MPRPVISGISPLSPSKNQTSVAERLQIIAPVRVRQRGFFIREFYSQMGFAMQSISEDPEADDNGKKSTIPTFQTTTKKAGP